MMTTGPTNSPQRLVSTKKERAVVEERIRRELETSASAQGFDGPGVPRLEPDRGPAPPPRKWGSPDARSYAR